MTGQRQWVHTAYPQQVRVGGGQIERLRPLLKDIGTRRVLVLGSARGFASPLGKALLSGLGRGVIPSVFADAAPGVPASAVQTAVRLALTDQIDTVVSFGGGSTVDLGKAVCFFLEQQAGTPGVSLNHGITIFASDLMPPLPTSL